MRVFVDSSTIIALARIGELELLKSTFGKVFVTKSIEKEILNPGHPDTAVIEKALGDWIVTATVKGNEARYRKLGLGSGEASLFLTGKENVLVVDELNARKLAESEGRAFTGLLGLILAAVEEKVLDRERALSMVDRLSDSSFRMSAQLYREMVRRIAEIGK